ncbi:alpha/beta fold hydrolase [Anaeromyxobacter paludicola]|uniref:Alpha/beta hydrolase n=1 Tax=Anaeromyxobacter paludicola TaxID=2918171 RepID=A0ABM7XDA4_9BACT|nr:alpha/beta fold hydrolase [Anaeromyxobacter paludicola]BDG09854.1 alpha/beta hydrolase [Anaeromyxobacter paludicola]
MREVSFALAAAAALALATWLHYLFWSWRFRLPGREDALVFADTRDGWRLALARRRPRGAPRATPVLLCHGLAANRGAMDFGLVRWSLSAFLSAAGFDCFALDLRGHGASRPTRRGLPRDWTFDTYVREDVPAALDAVRRETGAARVLWVGHSQGALLGLAACALYPEAVAGVVALAAPTHFRSQRPLLPPERLAIRLLARVNRFLARCLAPFSGFWHPPISEVAINGRNVSRPVFRRVLANVVEDMPPGVLRQFGDWVAHDRFAAADGAADYRALLARCRQPALFVAAHRDKLAPPEVVRAARDLWGGEKAYLEIGLAGGHACDYGHSDLLFGVRAPEEVFGPVRDWLAAHDAPAKALERGA